MLAHKSKFGFHPCDRATYLKLKELNKQALQARTRNNEGQVVGYQAPQPMPEPQVSSLFFTKTIEKTWDKKERVVLTESPFLMDDYRMARHPVPEEILVLPLSLTVEEISKLAA